MWYVKDEFSNKIYFRSHDVRKTQNFACRYNSTFKFSSQRMFSFTIYDFTGVCLFWERKIDVNFFTQTYGVFSRDKYVHLLAIKDYQRRHSLYLKRKYDLIRKLCKKYHVWSYNEYGRKCDSFDF